MGRKIKDIVNVTTTILAADKLVLTRGGVDYALTGQGLIDFGAKVGAKDVDETGLVNGMILQYNSTSGKLEYVVLSSGGTSLFDAEVTTFAELKTAIETTGHENILINGSLTFTSNLVIQAGKTLKMVGKYANVDHLLMGDYKLDASTNSITDVKLTGVNMVNAKVTSGDAFDGNIATTVLMFENCSFDMSASTKEVLISGMEVHIYHSFIDIPNAAIVDQLVRQTTPRTFLNGITFTTQVGSNALYLQESEQCSNIIFDNSFTGVCGIINSNASNIIYKGTGIFIVGAGSALDAPQTQVNNLIALTATVQMQATARLSNFKCDVLKTVETSSYLTCYAVNGQITTFTCLAASRVKLTNCYIKNNVTILSLARVYFVNSTVGSAAGGAKTITFDAGSGGGALMCSTEAVIVDNSAGAAYVAGNDLL